MLTRSRFSRDVVVLAGGTAIAQVVVVATTPVITRLYTPEQVGLLGVLVALTVLAGPFVCGRYEQAMLLPEREDDAASALALSLLITVAATVLVWAGALVWHEHFERFGMQETEALIWVAPAATFVTGVGLAMRSWMTRQRRFGLLAVSRTARSVGTAAAQIGAALAFGASGLAIAGGFVAGLVMEAVALLDPRAWPRRAGISPRAMWRAAVTYRRFPIYLMPGGVAVAVGSFGMPVFIGGLFGASAAGYFFVADRVLSLPVSLISQSVGTVLLQRLSVGVRDPEADVAGWIAMIFMGLLAAAVLPALVLAVVAPWLFELVFGPGWDESGRFAQAALLRAVVGFAAFPMTQAFIVYEKQDHLLAWQLATSVVQVASLFVGAQLGGVLLAVWLYSITSAVVLGSAAVLALSYAGVPWRRQPGVLLRGLREAARAVASIRPVRASMGPRG